MPQLTSQQSAFLNAQRVGHLSTADESGRPHVVPVCFLAEGDRLYITIDEKPKRAGPHHLKRVRNILENPHVSFVVDRYSDDWSQLGYVLIQGTAAILESGEEQRRAISSLRERYPQYQTMALEERPVIVIIPQRVVSWGNLNL